MLRRNRLGGGNGLICVQAGAVHEDDYPETNRNSFNYAAIVYKNSGELALRIWNRVWSKNNKDFRDDPEFHPVDQPFAEFVLGSRKNFDTIRETDRAIDNKNHYSYNRKSKYISDSPPTVDVWVGRKEELYTLNKLPSGVIVITGIGGQGKSALASRLVDQWATEHPRAFWDWRDCREQRERFRAHLVGIIEHWTDGDVTGEMLEGGETKDLVRLFFNIAEKQTGLIIFDNVDHYVNVEHRAFSLGVAEFVKAALERLHNLTIIFTCRPRVSYASTRYQEIHLSGISADETIELFELRGVKTKDNIEAINSIHGLTDGHPFWLNLIATQIALQPERCLQIINELESGAIDDRAKIIMNSTWKQLDVKQKTILRYMAELSGPEDVDWVFDCVKTSNEFKNQSKFNHSFFSLQALNLIVESRGKLPDQKEYDLHPIVRSYILSEYRGKRERKQYQEGILWVINTFIDKIGKKVSIAMPFSEVDVYIKKAEISIKKDDVTTSISSLLHIAEILVHRGIPGELFRIGEDILGVVERDPEKYIDLEIFHFLCEKLGHTYIEYGRRQEALYLVERYSRLVHKGTAQYVSVCGVACYVYWMLKDYEKAISWGKEGLRLKTEEHIDTVYESSHSLALAQRDSGDVESALAYFLSGSTIEEIIQAKSKEDLDASKLGNIGRCLQFNKDYDAAIRFFVKSAQALENKNGSTDILNQGYAALWIGEVLEAEKDYRNAYVAYRKSEIVWAKRAPLRVDEPREKAINVCKMVEDKSVSNLTESGIERLYKELLEG